MAKKQLSPEEKRRLTAWVDEIKFVGGFESYRVDLDVATKDDPNSRAVIIADEDDKVLLIRLYKNFFRLEDWQKKSDLVHEMVHGRIGVWQEVLRGMKEKMEYRIEEACVNDFTRAFDALLGEKERLRNENEQLRAEIARLIGGTGEKTTDSHSGDPGHAHSAPR